MPVVAIYARISTKTEGKDATQRQIDSAHKYLESHPELELYPNNSPDPALGGYRQAFYDEGKSAWRTGVRRPAWDAVEELALSGVIQGIVVYASDRIHRRSLEMSLFVSKIVEAGRDLVIYPTNGQGVQDFTSPEGRFSAGLMGLIATQEMETMTRRITSEKEAAAKAGRWNGGREPLGYMKVRPDNEPTAKYELVPHPVKAPELVNAIDGYLSGKSSISVLNEYNKNTGQNLDYNSFFYGLCSPTMTGRRYHLPQAIRKGKNARTILTTPYFLENNAAYHPGTWPAIITISTWDSLRDKLVNNRFEERGETPEKSLLGGMVYCAKCGGRMGYDGIAYKFDESGQPVYKVVRKEQTPPVPPLQAVKRYPTYRCGLSNGGCGSQIGATQLEAFIQREFHKASSRLLKMKRFTKPNKSEHDLIATENARTAIDEEKDTLYNDLRRGIIDEPQYARLKTKLDVTAKTLDERLSQLRSKALARDALLNGAELYARGDTSQRRTMLKMLIQRIDVRNIKALPGAKNVMHAPRITVDWIVGENEIQRTYGVGRADEAILVPEGKKPHYWESLAANP